MKNLPEIIIDGTAFQVDVMLSELREKENPLNAISFHYMEKLSEGYRLNYYPHIRNTYLLSSGEDPSVIPVIIQDMVKLDPNGVSRKYEIPLDQLPERDNDLKHNPDRYHIRSNGVLPSFKIAGRIYLADIANDQLRPINSKDGTIFLSELPFSARYDKQICIYDPLSGYPVKANTDINTMDPRLVLIAIPVDLHLDAYYFEKEHGLLDIRDKFPIIPALELESYPLQYHPKYKQQAENKLHKVTPRNQKRRGFKKS